MSYTPLNHAGRATAHKEVRKISLYKRSLKVPARQSTPLPKRAGLEKGRINAIRVRIRTKPQLNAYVLGHLHKGDSVTVLPGRTKGWVAIRVDRIKQTVWVWGAYIDIPGRKLEFVKYGGRRMIKIGDGVYIGPDGKRLRFVKKPVYKERIRFLSPLRMAQLTSPFGRRRRHPVNGGPGSLHKGVDLRARTDTPVFAVADGVVLSVYRVSYYGLLLTIRHRDGAISRYAHLSRALVRRGERVRAGEKIALSGDSGRTTGPHLHFELWVDGKAVDPARHIDFRR